MIKAVLFDFDETLQDRTEAFNNYASCFLDEFRPNLTQEEKQACINDMVETGNGGYVIRDEWYSLIVKKWNWQDAPKIEILSDHYDRRLGDFDAIFPDSPKVLKELKNKGYLVGVITNGPSYLQNHKLDVSNLRQYLDIAVVAGDVGYGKPDVRIFNYTAEELGVETSECLYVGDHPVNDIEGALNAGMSAIRMNWGWFEGQRLDQGVPVIDSIIDVLKYV